MSDQEVIVSAAAYCRNFPRRPQKIIPRENLYEHTDMILKNVSRIVYLEGEEQSGKTEFVAGYIERKPNEVIAVFLNPGDAHFYTPEYLRLVIAEQINWITKGVIENHESIDDAEFQRSLHRLQKVAKQKTITFLIDGLASPGMPGYELQKEMLSLFPFGQNEFRFVITGDDRLAQHLQLTKYQPKSSSIVPVSLEEAIEYFRDIENLSGKDVSDIRKFCAGSVGPLSRFRNLLESGRSIESIFNDTEGEISDLLRLEWKLDAQIPRINEILPFIIFSNRSLAASQVSSLSGLGSKEVIEIAKRSRFIECDAEKQILSIRSKGERAFLRKQYANLETEVQQKFIDELLKEPRSIESTRYLPIQLLEVGRYDDIIRRLDNSHFVRVLETEQSLGALKRHSDIGLKASGKSNDDIAKLRFGLSGSAVSGLALSLGTKNRIEAIIKLGDQDVAIEQAMLAPTKEERLKFLASVAKALYSNGQKPGPELKDKIKGLVDEVDIEALGTMSTEIACDILVVDFGLAIELFNKMQRHLDRAKESKVNGLGNDGMASDGNYSEGEQTGSSHGVGVDEPTVRSEEPHSRIFVNAIADYVSTFPASKILRQNSELAPRDELMILKQWIKKRRTDPEAWRVAEYALDVALKDLSRAPRIEDFRSIAVVLPYIDDNIIAERLVGRIQAQVGTQLALGTTEESIRLEILIERVRVKTSPSEAELSLIEIYSRIEQIPDTSVRVACLAWLLYSLQQFPNPVGLEEHTTLLSETTSKLIASIELLLKSSADHFQAARGAIYALARSNVSLAFQLISQINTQYRRDMAYALLADELANAKAFDGASAVLLQSIGQIQEESRRARTILRVLSKIAAECKRGSPTASCDDGIFSLWRTLKISNFRFIAVVHCYRIAMFTSKGSTRELELRKALEEIWPQILVDWVRIDLGYLLVRYLADVNESLAREWLSKVLELDRGESGPSEDLSDVLHMVTSIVIKCYSSIAPSDCDVQDPEFSRVAFLINSHPVPNRRVTHWCDLGIRLHYLGKHGLSKKISTNFVQTALDDDFRQNEYVRDTLIVDAAPLLYLDAPATFNHYVSKIADATLVESAKRSVCDLIFKKIPHSEPYKYSDTDEYELTQNEVLAISELLKTMESDSDIFEIVKVLSSSLVSRRNESNFRRTFAADRLNFLLQLIDEKLPQVTNIKHDGYKLVAKAQVYRAQVSLNVGSGVTPSHWTQLYDASRAISNVADRVVTTAMIVACSRGKLGASYPQWFADIKNDFLSIPTYLDRIDRYKWVAEILETFNKALAISLLKEGVALIRDPDADEESADKYKKMLDIAYRIDPDFVDKLIDVADHDRAKTSAKDSFSRRKKLEKSQKLIADNPDSAELNELSSNQIAKICVKNLASLNARRLPAKPFDSFERLIQIASALPMSLAFPIWSYVAENVVKKSAGVSHSDDFVRKMYSAVCSCGELVLALIGQSKTVRGNASSAFEGFVGPGERSEVMAAVAQWAQELNGRDIYISDPFFGPDDVDILFKLASFAPDSKISVLTSRGHLKSECGDLPPDEAFESAWNRLCDIDSIDISIHAISAGASGSHPIHDRWIVAGDSGLRLGTSSNSIGLARVSEISRMDGALSLEKVGLIEDFLSRRLRSWNGEKVMISSFYFH